MLSIFEEITIGSRSLLTIGVVCLSLILGFSNISNASELGHFAPAMMNIRDFVQPDSGSYFLLYNIYYGSDTLRDKNGKRVESIAGGRAKLNVNVDSYTTAPTYVHITDKKLFGANYGFMISQPFGNPSFQASLEFEKLPGLNKNINESSYGLGDTYLRPIWLGWNLGHLDVGASYGLYIPTGKYDYGKADNVGLGMWSHEFIVNAAYYVDEQKGTALTMAATYEIHHKKNDVDITPGSHLTLNYGVSQYLPLGKKFLADIGVAGYAQWQITKDRGSDVSSLNKDIKDQVYGLGLQAGLVYLPWNGQVTFKWIREFKAEDRFEGDFYTLSAAIPF